MRCPNKDCDGRIVEREILGANSKKDTMLQCNKCGQPIDEED